jgi:hypothetical protein
MQKTIIFTLVVLAAMVATRGPAQKMKVTCDHTQWIDSVLRASAIIKPGMTRKELLTVFAEEGGISTRQWRRYRYKDCPYIKVDVEFKPVGEPDGQMGESADDVIAKISTPFLEYSIMD